MRKYIDHYYKTCGSLTNDLEKIMYEYDNPYCYHFGPNKKEAISLENMLNSRTNIVNTTDLDKKR